MEIVQEYTDDEKPTRIVILNGRKGATVTAWRGKRRLSTVTVLDQTALLREIEQWGRKCGLKPRNFWQRFWRSDQ